MSLKFKCINFILFNKTCQTNLLSDKHEHLTQTTKTSSRWKMQHASILRHTRQQVPGGKLPCPCFQYALFFNLKWILKEHVKDSTRYAWNNRIAQERSHQKSVHKRSLSFSDAHSLLNHLDAHSKLVSSQLCSIAVQKKSCLRRHSAIALRDWRFESSRQSSWSRFFLFIDWLKVTSLY